MRQWAIYLNYCLISLFIIAYFSVAGLWLWVTSPAELKPNGPLPAEIQSKIAPFTCWTGWEQSWSFFSPNVNTVNSYTLLTTTLQNGLIKLVELPRMDKLKFHEKLKLEKNRKLYNDNMANSTYGFFRPDVARYISRANNEPGNQPIRTTFYLISTLIPPPKSQKDMNPKQMTPKERTLERYFVYRVHPDDL